MAGLFEYTVANKVMPDSMVHSNKAYLDSVQSVMRMEELQQSRPAIKSVETVDQSESLFDRISYNKGSFEIAKIENNQLTF